MKNLNKALLVIAISTPFISTANAQITDPSQAFTVSAIKSIDEVEVTIVPQKDFFIYKDKISIFDGNNPKPMKIKTLSGKPILKKFPEAPSHYVYESAVQAYVARPSTQLLKIRYQGCSVSGLCLPPQTKLIKVTND